jgi:hypothetical protein
MWIERKGKREVTKLYPNQGTLLFHFAVLPQLQYSCFSQLPNYPAGHFLVSRPAEMPLI